MFKKRLFLEQHYDLFSVARAFKNGEFSYEETQALLVIAAHYLKKCNEDDARQLATILKDFADEGSDYGPAAVCREIIRAVA